jgi:hypothetical protein
MAINYDRIPEELRWDRQWLLAGPDDNGKFKAPYSFGPRGPFKTKSTENTHWKELETILDACAVYSPCGIGYVLSKRDAYTCIDLDIKNVNNEPDKTKWTTQDIIDRHLSIIKAFNSYTERSASGQGYHIWIRGNIGVGCKRDGVEVYSQERFIVCTGDVVVDAGIEDRQDLLDQLVSEIKNIEAPKLELVELAPTEDDLTIFKRAREAGNADKFVSLCEGNWDDYSSQSEADLALMSMFTFYSKSNEQCRRLFRMTRLGDRAKATKNDYYLNNTIRLVRSREAIEEDIDAAAAAAGTALLATMHRATLQNVLTAPQNPVIAIDPAHIPVPADEPIPLPFEDETMPDDGIGLSWPPGIVGEIAQHMYNGAPRPVKEVSIVAALGLMAGICGKCYNIPQSGLNLYIVLIAKSAIGKEAMHSGISMLMTYLAEKNLPAAMNFIDFTDYASGPGLTKAVAANQSFVNVCGEWGRKLRRLAMEDGRDGPMQQLRTVMTNLYQKSGARSIVGGIGYSDKDKNVASVSGVAYSMIGEATPDAFYDALTDTMMADGFMSRFTIIEYNGKRPEENEKELEDPSGKIIKALTDIIEAASSLNHEGKTILVDFSDEAAAMLKAFNRECDINVNASDDEGYRQMWNRAQLKAKRIAALLAVPENSSFPIVQVCHVEWAVMLIRRDIALMDRKITTGDVGNGDAPREKKLLSIIQHFMKKGAAPGYQIPDKMAKEGVIPRRFMQISTQRVGSFTAHPRGQNFALDMTIKSLIDSGYICEMSKEKCFEKFEFIGKCYRVIVLPLTSLEQKEMKNSNRQL